LGDRPSIVSGHSKAAPARAASVQTSGFCGVADEKPAGQGFNSCGFLLLSRLGVFRKRYLSRPGGLSEQGK
jgi:hypothetical protein